MRLPFLLILTLLPALEAEPLRVLLVTGGHAYDNSFHSVFEQPDADWTITVDPHPRAFKRDIRSRYDIVVLYDMVVDGTDEQRQANLREFAEAGNGIVVLHHAILNYQEWAWFERMAGGKYFREAEGEWAKSTFQHDVEMQVRVKAEHPVVAGIDDFTIEDETYGGMRISGSNQVLLETDHPTSTGPLAWVSGYENSRVIYIQLGHGPTAHRDAVYRRLVRQAIKWAGGM